MNVQFHIKMSFVILLCILRNGEFTELLKINNSDRFFPEIHIQNVSQHWNHENIKDIKTQQFTTLSKQHEESAGSVVETMNANNTANTSTADDHAKLIAEFKRLWPVDRWRKYGLFYDDYLYLINEHWLRYPPPSETLQQGLGGTYILFTTSGCWGNIIVLFMYLR